MKINFLPQLYFFTPLPEGIEPVSGPVCAKKYYSNKQSVFNNMILNVPRDNSASVNHVAFILTRTVTGGLVVYTITAPGVLIQTYFVWISDGAGNTFYPVFDPAKGITQVVLTFALANDPPGLAFIESYDYFATDPAIGMPAYQNINPPFNSYIYTFDRPFQIYGTGFTADVGDYPALNASALYNSLADQITYIDLILELFLAFCTANAAYENNLFYYSANPQTLIPINIFYFPTKGFGNYMYPYIPFSYPDAVFGVSPIYDDTPDFYRLIDPANRITTFWNQENIAPTSDKSLQLRLNDLQDRIFRNSDWNYWCPPGTYVMRKGTADGDTIWSTTMNAYVTAKAQPPKLMIQELKS